MDLGPLQDAPSRITSSSSQLDLRRGTEAAESIYGTPAELAVGPWRGEEAAGQEMECAGVRRRGCGGESRRRGKRSVCLCDKRLIASWLLFLVVFFLIANALLFGSNVCLYGQIRAPTAGLNKIDSLFLRLQSHVPRFFLTCPTHIYDW